MNGQVERVSPAVALTAADLRRVRAVLFLNGLRGSDLDDAEQDVQVRLLEQPTASVEHVGAWACAVAARLAIDRHRRTKTRDALVDRLRVHRPSVHHDPDVALTSSVRAALAALDAELRAIVVLRYYADLSVAQIARLIEVPEGTVKSRLHRAASVLRAELEEDR